MILDRLAQFSSNQNLAQIVGTYASTDQLDLHMAGIPVLANLVGARDMGIGDDPALKVLCQVQTAFVSGGGGTLQVFFQGSTDDGTGAAAGYNTWWSSPLYAAATLVIGARLMDIDFPRPPDGIAVPRFVRLLYTIGAATTTAGQVGAWIVLDRLDQMYQSTQNAVLGGYPPGIVIAN